MGIQTTPMNQRIDVTAEVPEAYEAMAALNDLIGIDGKLPECRRGCLTVTVLTARGLVGAQIPALTRLGLSWKTRAHSWNPPACSGYRRSPAMTSERS
jgi:hypothetical protein